MNKKQEHEFDLFIWADLLNMLYKTDIVPSVVEVATRFKLSNRMASAYRFALVHRNLINTDQDLSKKLGQCRNISRDLRNRVARLSTENEILEAKVDFLMALEAASQETEPMVISTPRDNKYETTAVALLSDTHVEEHVDPLVVNNINKYTPADAQRRIELYFRRLLWMISAWRKGGWKIDKLVLGILGDIINGYIHEEFLEDNFMSPTEAVTFAQDLLISGIQYLADAGGFKEIIVVCKFGNHGRTSKRKKYSTGYKNSYEFMMYTQIQKIFRDHKPGYEHVKFVIERGEFTHIYVYDKKLNFSHGDHFNYQGGIGGVLIPFNKWMHKMNSIIDADKYYIAHWHGYQQIKGGVMNGSVIGYSPFAMGHAFTPEPPQQHLELIDSKRGFTLSAPIILEDWQ